MAVDFKTVLAEVEERNKKSDLENLAHAHVQLSKHIEECKELLVEMETLAEKPSIPEGSVRKLYDRVFAIARR